MNATTTWKKGLSFTGTSDSGFLVDLGADPSVGGANDGFRPMELVALGLAGCTAMDVISILRKKQQDITAFSVSVQAQQSAVHPKVFTHIILLYIVKGNNLEESAVRRAIELSAAKYCPAQAMLGSIVPIKLLFQIIDDLSGAVREGAF